jgi:hypothetical protein
MTHLIRTRRTLLFSLLAVSAALLVPSHRASAQASQRGQPTTPFAFTDLGKLHWLEGTWAGTAPGEPTFYERYHFANDSTIEITYFGDSTLSRQTGTGRVYVSVGRIFYTFGAGRWGASHVDDGGIFFVPQVNAHNTLAWKRGSDGEWTATLRAGMTGREHVTVSQMRRLSGR